MQVEYDLSRFVQAQQRTYTQAKIELSRGRKLSCWMWYIFPQMKGLGESDKSKYYGIVCLAEAQLYLNHQILGVRLRELCQLLLTQSENNPKRIFGENDAKKLQSCLTLFDLVEPNGDFAKLLDKFFAGNRDSKTEILCQQK